MCDEATSAVQLLCQLRATETFNNLRVSAAMGCGCDRNVLRLPPFALPIDEARKAPRESLAGTPEQAIAGVAADCARDA